jgi:hypothetical protein
LPTTSFADETLPSRGSLVTKLSLLKFSAKKTFPRA